MTFCLVTCQTLLTNTCLITAVCHSAFSTAVSTGVPK